MKYRVGQKVWLREFDNGLEVVPRQLAEIEDVEKCDWGVSYLVRAEPDPEDPTDDGLSEVTEDQIEGLAS